jgi:hypothetical protein
MTNESDADITGCLIAIGLFLLAAVVAVTVLILTYG